MIAPGTVVIFVENHTIPVDGMYPLVLQLDAARLAASEKILKRPEADDRTVVVGRFVVQFRIARQELPPFEIDMRAQILFPGTLHGGFEGQDQQPFPSHAACQLVGREGFAETHFAIPEEMRRTVVVGTAGTEIFAGLLHGCLLLGAHGKMLRALEFGFAPLPHGAYRRPDLANRTTEPLSLGILHSHSTQHAVYLVVGKRGAVATHGRLLEDNAVGARSGPQRWILLRHAMLHIDGGVSDLQQPTVLRVGIFVGIDGRMRRRAGGEKVCHLFLV